MDGDNKDSRHNRQQQHVVDLDDDVVMARRTEQQQQRQQQLRATMLLQQLASTAGPALRPAVGRSPVPPDIRSLLFATGTGGLDFQQQQQAQEDIWNRRRDEVSSAAISQIKRSLLDGGNDERRGLSDAMLPPAPPSGNRRPGFAVGPGGDLEQHRASVAYLGGRSALSRLQEAMNGRRDSSGTTIATSDVYEALLLRARLAESSAGSSTYGYGSVPPAGLGSMGWPVLAQRGGLAYDTELLRAATMLSQHQQAQCDDSGAILPSAVGPSSSLPSSRDIPFGSAGAVDLPGWLSRSTKTVPRGYNNNNMDDLLFADRQQRGLFSPSIADDNDPSFLAIQRDALRRELLEQQALNDRLELLTRHQRGQLLEYNDYNHRHRSAAAAAGAVAPDALHGLSSESLLGIRTSRDAAVAALLPDGDSYHRPCSAPTAAAEAAALPSRSGRGTTTTATETTKEASRNDYEITMSWEALVGNGGLADANLRGVVSDLHIAIMAQMRPCQLNHEDRIGLYKTRDIGFRGMCCKHCGGVTGFGRYFPGSLTSLVNGNICRSIMKHLTEECRKCPDGLRESVLKLELHDEHNQFHYRRGSRRRFFTKIWDKIQRGGDLAEHGSGGVVSAETEVSSSSSLQGDNNTSDNNNRDPAIATDEDLGIDAPSFRNDPGIPWPLILENSEIVHPADRHLVTDTIFAATAQTRPCQVTEGDRVGRCKDHKLGSMGLCCKHCGGKPGAYGRYFPSNLHTFAQVEVCKQVVKHITRKCPACPAGIRQAIMDLQRREQGMSLSTRFPSRMIFFRRVWSRFHVNDKAESTVEGAGAPEGGTLSYNQIPWDKLVKVSPLVQLDDKGLIPDSQFISIAQMDICELTEEDRIGYNKGREIGFTGLCCRYCRGKPGFGRFFPNTVRNLEKTSARETMVSHISLFCQHCPDDVRDAVLSLKRIETSRDGSSTMKGLIYGSGKLFFRRIWGRLQGRTAGNARSDSTDEEEYSKQNAKQSPKQQESTNSPALSRSCRGDQDDIRPGDDTSSDESTDSSTEDKKSGGKRKSDRSVPAHTMTKKQKSTCQSESSSQRNAARKGRDVAHPSQRRLGIAAA